MPVIDTMERRRRALRNIYSAYENDKSFNALRRSAKRLVPGEGTVFPFILFVGEAPGAGEDERGEPFVGPSGKVLNELLNHIGLDREDCFITNVVLYRPPKNRDPTPAEVEASLPYLVAQHNVLRPPLIVTLGKFAYEALGGLGRQSITYAHGKPYLWEGQTIVPMLHPAYALRNAEHISTLYEDIEKVREVLRGIRDE